MLLYKYKTADSYFNTDRILNCRFNKQYKYFNDLFTVLSEISEFVEFQNNYKSCSLSQFL